jgi:hypothetical protein
MKKIILTTLVVLFTLTAFPAMSKEYVNEIGIYTKDEFVLRRPAQTAEIIDQFNKEAPEKNIIIYVHGRGRAIDEKWETLKGLEDTYNAKMIMFHWQSWTSMTVRPTDKAAASADELAEVFKQIKEYKEANPEIFQHKKISLLTHSMGNVVLRDFVEKHYKHDLNDSTGRPLFNSWVSVGADEGLTDHKSWVGAIDFAEKKYITMNDGDLVLRLSYMLDIKSFKPQYYKLGLGFRDLHLTKKTIAKYTSPDTTYIDLSKSLGKDHRYFESETVLMFKVFNPILNGNDFKPQLLGVKYKEFNGNMFYIND